MELNDTIFLINATTMLPSSDAAASALAAEEQQRVLIASAVAAVLAAILWLISKTMRGYLPKKMTPAHLAAFYAALALNHLAFAINVFYWPSVTFFFCNGVILFFIVHAVKLISANQNAFDVVPRSTLGWLRELVLLVLFSVSLFWIIYCKRVIRYADFLGIFFHVATYIYARHTWLTIRSDELMIYKGRKRIGALKKDGDKWVEVLDEKKNDKPDVIVMLPEK